MGLKRSDISSPFLGGAIGAIPTMIFFPPGSASLVVGSLRVMIGAMIGVAVVECLAGVIAAPKLTHKLAFFVGLIALVAAAYLAVEMYSPRLNPQFDYTLF